MIGRLKAIHLPVLSLIAGICIADNGAIAQRSASVSLITANSAEGEQLLFNSSSRSDFLPLSIHFVTQENQAYCGVASIVMVLNGLGIPAPEAPQYQPYRIFTQDNFFGNKATQQVMSAKAVSRGGMTLAQLGKLLASYDGVKVEVNHAGNSSLEKFRATAVENLTQPGNFVIVNYLRKEIGQQIGGHISPLAAYNKETDRFLILDVSRYKYPPVWVKTADLWKAMNTTDSTSQKTRGFVFVSRE